MPSSISDKTKLAIDLGLPYSLESSESSCFFSTFFLFLHYYFYYTFIAIDLDGGAIQVSALNEDLAIGIGNEPICEGLFFFYVPNKLKKPEKKDDFFYSAGRLAITGALEQLYLIEPLQISRLISPFSSIAI